MQLSFVIPAYNEQSLIGAAIDSIHEAARAAGDELAQYEIIVVNDASTDRTAEIARARGARVLDVHLRHIAAVRNAGAKAALFDGLVFLDADTTLPAPTLRAAIRAMQEGALGGGSDVRMDGMSPGGRVYFWLFMCIWRPLRYAAGCFVFARREAFNAAGGFDERYFAGEEMYLSRAMKRQGRWVILREHVVSSGRKARLYGFTRMTLIALRMLVLGPRSWQKREGLELWYEGKRE
jgi:glycosyltransferase involved in cell wall biosynthesis